MPLTNVQIRKAKPALKAYKLSDEKGLFLYVMPNEANIGGINIDLAGKKRSYRWAFMVMYR